MPRTINVEVTVYDREDYDTYEENLTNAQAAQNIKSCLGHPLYNYSGTSNDFLLFAMQKALERAVEVLERTEDIDAG